MDVNLHYPYVERCTGVDLEWYPAYNYPQTGHSPSSEPAVSWLRYGSYQPVPYVYKHSMG